MKTTLMFHYFVTARSCRVNLRPLRLPQVCPAWVQISALCLFSVTCAVCFMGAVNSIFYPY